MSEVGIPSEVTQETVAKEAIFQSYQANAGLVKVQSMRRQKLIKHVPREMLLNSFFIAAINIDVVEEKKQIFNTKARHSLN